MRAVAATSILSIQKMIGAQRPTAEQAILRDVFSTREALEKIGATSPFGYPNPLVVTLRFFKVSQLGPSAVQLRLLVVGAGLS